MEFSKFPSIRRFSEVWKGMRSRNNKTPVMFNAKPKMHGTNAAVYVSMDDVKAAYRNGFIEGADTSFKFGDFVETTRNAWFVAGLAQLSQDPEIKTVIYRGEWAGRGILGGAAVNRLDRQYFFLFSVEIERTDGVRYLITDPAWIEDEMPDLDQVIALPWIFSEGHIVDPEDTQTALDLSDKINAYVDSIADRDPFIADTFGIEGHGEGIVCMGMDPLTRESAEVLTFKAKTKKFAEVKQKKAASPAPEIPAEAVDFVDAYVTEARCQQAVDEACDGEASMQKTAAYLKWLRADIIKEGDGDRIAAGLTWKQIGSLIDKAAVGWLRQQCEVLV